jgi:Zn-dependent oligopeptidase
MRAGALVVGDAAELAGLSKDELETAALAAKARGLDGKWLIPLLNTTQQPMLASLEHRATRKALFRASWTRTERGDANDYSYRNRSRGTNQHARRPCSGIQRQSNRLVHHVEHRFTDDIRKSRHSKYLSLSRRQ